MDLMIVRSDLLVEHTIISYVRLLVQTQISLDYYKEVHKECLEM